MKNNSVILLLFGLSFSILAPMASSNAQEIDAKQAKKEKKAQEERLMFFKVSTLVNQQQFVFKAQYGEGSDMVFVVVDSTYGEVQSGNRNNLEGRITQYDVKTNEKNKTISVTIKMRGVMYTADVFLFIGPSGSGHATVNCEFPGSFAFDGEIVDFEHANIYEGGSHPVY